METSGRECDHPEEVGIRRALRRLFNSAAAMSIAVHCRLDAVQVMNEFLAAVKAHPEERDFVVRLFLESFSESFFLKHAPVDVLMYCMSELRWSEILEFASRKREEDVAEHRGIACYGIWQDVLESFDDGWRERYYQDFIMDSAGSSGPVPDDSN